MSTTAQHQEEQQCQYSDCDETGAKWEFTNGKFCSTEHWRAHQGKEVLDEIRHAHDWCATCFRKIKVIDRPSDDELEARGVPQTIREVYRGLQYPTDHTAFVEDFLPLRRAELEVRPPQKAIGRYGCECGNVDPRHRDTTLARLQGADMLRNLAECLIEFQDEPVDVGALIDAYNETGELEYAIGVGLHGGEV